MKFLERRKALAMAILKFEGRGFSHPSNLLDPMDDF